MLSCTIKPCLVKIYCFLGKLVKYCYCVACCHLHILEVSCFQWRYAWKVKMFYFCMFVIFMFKQIYSMHKTMQYFSPMSILVFNFQSITFLFSRKDVAKSILTPKTRTVSWPKTETGVRSFGCEVIYLSNLSLWSEELTKLQPRPRSHR